MGIAEVDPMLVVALADCADGKLLVAWCAPVDATVVVGLLFVVVALCDCALTS